LAATKATVKKAELCVPAEWEPHEATWLAFPHHHTDFPGKLSALPWTFAEMARVLCKGERVRLLCQNSAERRRAERTFDRAGVALEQVDFYECATNRSWLRDTLPIWAFRGNTRVALKFRFDGWSRYRDHDKDDRAGSWVAKRFGPRLEPTLPDGQHIILEGGSVDFDGRGTVLTTEECLLSSKRARFRIAAAELGARREAAEAAFHEWFGARQVIWLQNGIAGDDTSGHIDDFARLAPSGRVLVCASSRRRDADFAPLLRARKVLLEARDATGRRLEVVELPMPEIVTYKDMGRLPASYANFYVANAAVLVPVFNDVMDRTALDIIAGCFPDRPVVGIYARDLVLGLGTLHCSTMQQPRATRGRKGTAS
jgi:agmatine deiminase